MKKLNIIILAIISLFLTSCNKQEVESPSTKLTPVRLIVSLTQPEQRTAFTPKDGNRRVLSATWQKGDELWLIMWQEGDDWKQAKKRIEKNIRIPEEAEGKQTVDLSSSIKALDLSIFDKSKEVKYALVRTSINLWETGKGCQYYGLGTDSFAGKYDRRLNTGLLNDVTLASPIRKASLPEEGKTLVLQTHLEWRCAILAVKFERENDTNFKFVDKFIIRMKQSEKNNIYTSCYDPILKEYNRFFGTSNTLNLYFKSTSPLDEADFSAALDEYSMRYFTMPNDGGDQMKIQGSDIDIEFQMKVSGKEKTYKAENVVAFKKNISIEEGKCYGINIKVKKEGDKIFFNDKEAINIDKKN